MSETIDYYLSLPYRVEYHKESDGYTAIMPELPGCMTCAGTLDEARRAIKEAMELWLEVAIEDGDEIPLPAVMI